MKGIGEKVLGWFIVPEDGSATTATEGRGRPGEEESGDEHVRSIVKASSSSTPSRDHAHAVTEASFDAIYRAKGLPDFDCERLAKVLDLLASLPKEATQDVKRAIVGAALSAFGVPIDRIVATATTASAALDAYAMETERQTSDVIDRGQARIEQLTREITEMRLAMDHERAAQDDRIQSIVHEKAHVRGAIDFFAASSLVVEKPRLVRLR